MPPMIRRVMPGVNPTLLTCAAAWLVVGATSEASGQTADEKKACIGGYERAQELRKQGKLRGSKEQLLVCSRPTCPKVLRDECSKWLDEVQASMPSVVVEGRDADDRETAQIKVSVDGVVVAERLDGRSIDVDPGPHVFAFQHGDATSEQSVLIREGERNRKLVASFAKKREPTADVSTKRDETRRGRDAASSSSSRPEPTSPTPIDDDASSAVTRRPVRPITYAFAGLTVIGAAGFATFALIGKNKAGELATSCSPRCATRDVDDLRRTYLVGDIALGVSIIALGAAVVTHATRPRVVTTGRVIDVDITPSQGGLTARLGGAF